MAWTLLPPRSSATGLTIAALFCASADLSAAPAHLGVEASARKLVHEKGRRGESRGEIHLGLAAVYARRGKSTKVFKHLRAARKLGIAASRVDLVAGPFYRRAGRHNAAIATLMRVLVHHPAQPHALVHLWKTLYEVRLRKIPVQIDLEEIRLRLAAYGLFFPKEYKPNPTSSATSNKLTVKGYAALLAQREKLAVGLFKGAIEASPPNARAHRGLGIAYARQKDFQRAAGAYLLYLDLNPDAPDAAAVDRMLATYWKNIVR